MPCSVCSSLHGVNLNVKKLSLYIYIYRPYSRKVGHACNFSEKGQNRAKYLKILAKMYEIWKYIEKKGSLMHVTTTCMKQLEYALIYIWNICVYICVYVCVYVYIYIYIHKKYILYIYYIYIYSYICLIFSCIIIC